MRIVLTRSLGRYLAARCARRSLPTLTVRKLVAGEAFDKASYAANFSRFPSVLGFYNEMRRYSASLTLCIAYGKRAPTYDGVDASGFSVKEFYRLEHEFNFFLEVGE